MPVNQIAVSNWSLNNILTFLRLIIIIIIVFLIHIIYASLWSPSGSGMLICIYIDGEMEVRNWKGSGGKGTENRWKEYCCTLKSKLPQLHHQFQCFLYKHRRLVPTEV